MATQHQFEQPVFQRFQWVIERQLARASAPSYNGHDSDQSMTPRAVQFLLDHGINNVISLNQFSLSDDEIGLLNGNQIEYTHLEVKDFQPPTLAQLEAVISLASSGRVTLVYCGYGHGRTGTAISALQISMGRRLSHVDYEGNHVETEAQMQVLDQLARMLGG